MGLWQGGRRTDGETERCRNRRRWRLMDWRQEGNVEWKRLRVKKEREALSEQGEMWWMCDINIQKGTTNILLFHFTLKIGHINIHIYSKSLSSTPTYTNILHKYSCCCCCSITKAIIPPLMLQMLIFLSSRYTEKTRINRMWKATTTLELCFCQRK